LQGGVATTGISTTSLPVGLADFSRIYHYAVVRRYEDLIGLGLIAQRLLSVEDLNDDNGER